MLDSSIYYDIIGLNIPVGPRVFEGHLELEPALYYLDEKNYEVMLDRTTGKIMTYPDYQAQKAPHARIVITRREFNHNMQAGGAGELGPFFADLHAEYNCYADTPHNYAALPAQGIREQIEIAKTLLEVLLEVEITDAQTLERRGNRLAEFGYPDFRGVIDKATDSPMAAWRAERALAWVALHILVVKFN